MALTCSHLQYERLRTAYNSVIDEGSGMQKAPPIEEWDGMRGLCKSLFCRSDHNEICVVSSCMFRFLLIVLDN